MSLRRGHIVTSAALERGRCCAMAAKDKIDDGGYLKKVINDVKTRLSVDGRRIYLAGFSNGGILVYRFAEEHPDEIAAVAGISSTIGSIDPQRRWDWILPEPDALVPVFIAHGLDDESIFIREENSAYPWSPSIPLKDGITTDRESFIPESCRGTIRFTIMTSPGLRGDLGFPQNPDQLG